MTEIQQNDRRAVICGGGIAGLATAYWLRTWGHDPIVLESAAAARPGGQAVDVRGPALEVVRRMGVGDELRAARTVMHGMSVVDADGAEVFRDTDVTLTGGPLAGPDVEILRDDLLAVLQAAIGRGDRLDIRYGTTIDRIDQRDGLSTVRLSDGSTIRASVVIGADGLHSRTRGLAFEEAEVDFRDLGSHLSVFSAPNEFDLSAWQVFSSAENTMAGVYTARGDSEVRVNLGFRGAADYDYRDLEAQRAAVDAAFAGQRWWIPRLLELMHSAPDFYLAPMIQVLMPRWSAASTVLVGDAAWCTTPMSGQGTSLALVGGYVLAGELARRGLDDAQQVRRGLEAYEKVMRPFVERNQQLALINEGRSREMFASGETGATQEVGTAAAEGIEEHWVAGAATAIELPDYAAILSR